MARRTPFQSPLESTDTTFGPAEFAESIEHIRQGTRQQFESAWVRIEGAVTVASHDFLHELGEVPWIVDVLLSGTADGGNPSPAIEGTDVTVTKDATNITVQNDNSTITDRYFKVRAM